MGHHENRGIAPIPPWILPLPSHCILSLASPHESHDPVHLVASSLADDLGTTADEPRARVDRCLEVSVTLDDVVSALCMFMITPGSRCAARATEDDLKGDDG